MALIVLQYYRVNANAVFKCLVKNQNLNKFVLDVKIYLNEKLGMSYALQLYLHL